MKTSVLKYFCGYSRICLFSVLPVLRVDRLPAALQILEEEYLIRQPKLELCEEETGAKVDKEATLVAYIIKQWLIL